VLLQSRGYAVEVAVKNDNKGVILQVDNIGVNRDFHELNDGFLAIASTMGGALSEADIRKAAAIVRQISDDVKVRSERATCRTNPKRPG